MDRDLSVCLVYAEYLRLGRRLTAEEFLRINQANLERLKVMADVVDLPINAVDIDLDEQWDGGPDEGVRNAAKG